jgi:hypothetical protein
MSGDENDWELNVRRRKLALQIETASPRQSHIEHQAGGDYDPTSATFAPDKAGTPNCGHACHVAVKTKDYVFHPYQIR